MPTPQQILRGLEELANGWRPLAVFWHAYFGALLMSLCLGARPDRRLAGVLLSLPLLSVSALAWMSANPFNGTLFALTGIASIAMAVKLPEGRVGLGPRWALIAGCLLSAFGWVYPHFLETSPFLTYLYAAPTGLVPCPTLSIVIGVSLILNALGSRLWCFVLGLTGVFYGIFGAVRLGVAIDVFLLAGALSMVFLARTVRATRPRVKKD
jgi:hypothetical protein